MNAKNTIKGVLIFGAIVLGSTAVLAKGKISVSPYLRTSYAVISVKPAIEEFYSVAIFNSAGDLVYLSDRVDSGNVFSRLFDFSKMEDGVYNIRLRSKGKSSIEESFTVHNGVLLNSGTEKEITGAEVKIWKNSDFVFISHLNRNLNSMFVSIENDRGSVIFDKRIPAELAYSGKFNVSALPEGNYSMNFMSGNKVFSYEFNK